MQYLAQSIAYKTQFYLRNRLRGWEAWNQHFLQQILSAVSSYPGKRIVVIAGAEHGYWLREHLSTQSNVKLLDSVEQLKTEMCK